MEETPPHATEMLLPDLATTRGEDRDPGDDNNDNNDHLIMLDGGSQRPRVFISLQEIAGLGWVTISFCNFPLNYLYYISLAENSKTFSID